MPGRPDPSISASLRSISTHSASGGERTPMKKYRFGFLALVFGLVGVVLAGRGVDAQTPPAPAGATRSFSIATLAPAGSTWMRVLESWGREVRRRSNKSLSLTFYPGGVQ